MTVYIVDVDGEAVAIAAASLEDASAADIAELEDVVRSIGFEPSDP